MNADLASDRKRTGDDLGQLCGFRLTKVGVGSGHLSVARLSDLCLPLACCEMPLRTSSQHALLVTRSVSRAQAALDAAWASAAKDKVRVRAVLITSPNNPLGIVYTK